MTTTTWNYDANRGFLISKIYADSNGTTYSNNVGGKIVRRTWARGITADYTYNNAGEMTAMNYSDATPDLSYTYDRRGRRTSVTQGTNLVNIAYNDVGQVASEANVGGLLNGITVTNVYDSVFRRSSLQVLTNGVSIQSISYTYDNGLRLKTVSDGTNSAEYVYLANANLITNIVFKRTTTTVMTTSRQYDNLDRLTSISTANSTNGLISSHSYQYNGANQRIRATLADGSYWEYGYDGLGQVTNAVKKWSDGSLVAGQQFSYGYDSIGNRTSAKSGGDANGLGLRTFSYTANSLNQYTQRTVPGTFDVIGTAESNATVTVNNSSTFRRGTYFWKELAVTNTSAAQYPAVSVVGVKNNVGTNQEDAVTTVTGYEFVPKTPEVYSYDLDGNLTGDGRWTYTWDAENRLTAMESLTNSPAASRRKLEFSYDHQNRRTKKKTYVWNSQSSSYDPQSSLLFVYDDWNLLAEINAPDAPNSPGVVHRTYTWGLDLSGSLQGAGGVGGLLAVKMSGVSHFYVYDGNGNVVTLVQTDNGSVSANYEYGAFAEPIRHGGSVSDSNPFRFSTKYQDDETGLLDYGLRFYSPKTGRWLSRDPIGQRGGSNLYGIVGNDPITRIDGLGLFIIANCHFQQYLRELGVPYNASPLLVLYDLPNTYPVAPYVSDMEKLIVVRMLQSNTGFILDGVGAQVLDSIRRHVGARMRIVGNAARSVVRFQGNPAVFVDSLGNPVPVSLLGTDPELFFELVNNPGTLVDCQRWATILFETGLLGSNAGIHRGRPKRRPIGDVHIPGDWLYMVNTTYDTSWRPVYQGENLIHVGINNSGQDIYYGHLNPDLVLTEAGWRHQINTVWSNNLGTEFGHAEWNLPWAIKYPGNGLLGGEYH